MLKLKINNGPYIFKTNQRKQNLSRIKNSIYLLQNLSSKECNLSKDRGIGHRVALKGVDTTWHDAGRQPLFIDRGAAIHKGENDEMLPL